MNLKELIKEVERLKKRYKQLSNKQTYGHYGITELDQLEFQSVDGKIEGIKQTVETVDCKLVEFVDDYDDKVDWQQLKKLLGVK